LRNSFFSANLIHSIYCIIPSIYSCDVPAHIFPYAVCTFLYLWKHKLIKRVQIYITFPAIKVACIEVLRYYYNFLLTSWLYNKTWILTITIWHSPFLQPLLQLLFYIQVVKHSLRKVVIFSYTPPSRDLRII